MISGSEPRRPWIGPPKMPGSNKGGTVSACKAGPTWPRRCWAAPAFLRLTAGARVGRSIAPLGKGARNDSEPPKLTVGALEAVLGSGRAGKRPCGVVGGALGHTG